MRKLAPLAALLAIAGVVPAALAAEANRPAKRPKLSQIRLERFGSCDGLVRYGRRQSRRGPGAVPPPPAPPALPALPAPLPSLPAPTEGTPPPAAAPVERIAEDDSSGTNVQERGVDEPDLVKTAGTRIFAIAGGELRAIDAAGEPRLLDSLELPGWGHVLLLHASRALVISHDLPAGSEPEPDRPRSDGFARYDPGVAVLTEVDVSDPAALRVVRTERIRGVHVSSRLTGHTARVVVWTHPRATYQPALRDELHGWLPRRALRKGGRGRPRLRRAAPCRRVLRPATFSGVDVLTVLTIDLAKGLPAVDSDAIMSGGQVVYGSQDSLYVATQKWTPAPEGSAATTPPPRTITTVHRFGTADPDSTHYRASGQVPGFLLNQFSLSEHRGVLRVASTEEPEWSDWSLRRESESFVTVLDERDGALVQIGRVGGLGKGERIYAVRFIGDAGYVVTFRQVDPLYVVDLEKPTAPVVRGELKIQGYSAYLHPLEPGLLLGVGQDASEGGVTLGTQLSLFDVTDPSRPRRLHQAVVDRAYSNAELDHHAFLFWAPRKLAVLPLTVYGREPFQGALGFGVRRAEGIAQVGRAEHPEAAILRSFVARGRLFTLSDAGLELNDLDTLAERGWLPFP